MKNGTDFNTYLKTIFTQIQYLEQEGINIDNKIIKSTLATVCHNNLGAHTIFGFVEFFQSSHFRRFCLLSREETKLTTTENIEMMRRNESYIKHVSEFRVHKKSSVLHVKEVKINCILNNLAN